MSKKFLLVFTFMLALSACSAANQWEDLTAKYNSTTHLLSTELGRYQVCFPQQPVAIPGQHIKNYLNSEPNMSAFAGQGRRLIPQQTETHTYDLLNDDYRADFQSVGQGLTLTARHHISDDTTDVKALPGPGRLARISSRRVNLDTKTLLSDRIDKTEKELGLSETSRSPLKSADHVHFMEAIGTKPLGNVFKLHAISDGRSQSTYTLLAEGSQQAVDGAEAQRFFDSFSYLQPVDSPTLVSPQYGSSHSIDKLNKIKDLWNPLQAKLCESILKTGLTSSETLQQVRDAFKSPSEKLKKTNLSYRQEWRNYAGCLQDKLGDNYRLIAKDDMANRKVFGRRGKAELYLEITKLEPKGALAISLDDEGKLVDCYAHMPVSDLLTRMGKAISRHGVMSREASGEITQAFAYPMPGVSLDYIIDTLKNELGPLYAVYAPSLGFFNSYRDNNPNDTCLVILLNGGKGIKMLLDSNGKLIQSEYF